MKRFGNELDEVKITKLFQNGECEVVPLDFQTIRCGSPVFDLLYFIDFGFGDDFRKTHFQATIDYYYSELCAALHRLNLNPHEIYSREDFEYELQEVRTDDDIQYVLISSDCYS